MSSSESDIEWRKSLAKELLKPKRTRFKRRRVFSPNLDKIWTMDLMDMHRYSTTNNGYRYILVVLDIFSRYAWAHPLKNKTGEEVKKGLQHILRNDGNRSPKKIWCDDGREFFNTVVQNYLRTKNITLYSTYNEPKAAIAERFIRTLRRKIETTYIVNQNTVWYDVLQKLVDEYNASYHRSIGMTPQQATKSEHYGEVFDSLYSAPPQEARRTAANERRYTGGSRLRVGDRVRISLHKRNFEKGATANWSEEIFTISQIMSHSTPTVYRLKDLLDENIEGTFYREQLEKTNQEIYRIDKIVKKRRKNGQDESLVRWSGYSDKFDSWIPTSSVANSRN